MGRSEARIDLTERETKRSEGGESWASQEAVGRASLFTTPVARLRKPAEPGRLVAEKRGGRRPLVCSIALVFTGMLVVAAFAQDEPPKAEAPKAVAPPAKDSQVPLEPAPQEVQKKAPAPVDKEKAAPTAPDDKEKAAPPSAPGDTQKEAPSAAEDMQKKAAPSNPENTRQVFELAEALSTRYKLIERYGPEEDNRKPQLITQYRVGVLETTKYETDRAKGAPERKERQPAHEVR